MSKSQDGNVKTAVAAIKGMDSVDEINTFISEEAETKNRSTVLAAATERIEELNTPVVEEITIEPVGSEEKGAEPGAGNDEYAPGQSLGWVHDKENM